MDACETSLTVELPPEPPAIASRAQTGDSVAGYAALLDPVDRESLLLNLDASLRVHAWHHFFGWTQGLLQNLVKHDLLVCALRRGDGASFHIDSVARPSIDPASMDAILHQDTMILPQLARVWEENEFHAFMCDAGIESPLSGSALARELDRQQAGNVIVHGTYDAFGRPASVFVFACPPKAVGPRQVFLAELIVPFLHLAWLRTQIKRPQAAGPPQRGADLLSTREREILRWVHVGKTNIEIGAILDISPLTVKNHVQRILRKLDVQNRTQAIGKALALGILSL
jgi:transcriptional regulator EpsA